MILKHFLDVQTPVKLLFFFFFFLLGEKGSLEDAGEGRTVFSGWDNILVVSFLFFVFFLLKCRFLL